MPRIARHNQWSVTQHYPTPHRRRRALSALLAILGMLIWAVAAAPQIVSLAPQGVRLPLITTSWISSLGSLIHTGQPVEAMTGSGASPGAASACSTPNASAIGSNLRVPANAWVCGDALAVGGDVVVQGRVQGNALSIGGGVIVSGEVSGDVTAIGGDITVQPGGHVHGKLATVGGHIIIQPGALAEQAAPVSANPLSHNHSAPNTFHLFALETSSFWLGLLFWVSAALGLTAFVPEAVGHVRYTIAHRFLLSGFSGAVLGLVALLLAAALFLTCLGIPVTVAIGVAVWLAWVTGTVAFGSWLGASLLRGLGNREPSLLLSSLIGVVLLSLLKALPVAGLVVSVTVGCVALGASIITLLSARRVSYAHLRW